MKNVKVVVEPVLISLETAMMITELSKSTIEKLRREKRFPEARAASDKVPRFLYREIKEFAENLPVANFLPPPNCAEGGRKSKRKPSDA